MIHNIYEPVSCVPVITWWLVQVSLDRIIFETANSLYLFRVVVISKQDNKYLRWKFYLAQYLPSSSCYEYSTYLKLLKLLSPKLRYVFLKFLIIERQINIHLVEFLLSQINIYLIFVFNFLSNFSQFRNAV